jgi:hypothetical protein
MEKSFEEMSLEEIKAYRASKHISVPKKLSQEEKRELFSIFWAQEKYKYGKTKELENIIWLHLVTMKLDEPDKFEDGLKSFGLKK